MESHKSEEVTVLAARKGPNLRQLTYSPDINPLLSPGEIKVKQRHIRSGITKELVDTLTGEVCAVSAHHVIEERDDAEFVKVFAAGLKSFHELSRTASRVFQLILEVYQKEPMTGGFADSIYLSWNKGKLNGLDPHMSEDTYNRGLKELLSKHFLAPRTPYVFWVNPSMFFKGNRVLFIREYVRRQSNLDQQSRAFASAA